MKSRPIATILLASACLGLLCLTAFGGGSDEDAKLARIYEESARALGPEDVFQHYALANWCAEHELWDAMRKETDTVLFLEPEHAPTLELIAKHAGEFHLAGIPVPRKATIR